MYNYPFALMSILNTRYRPCHPCPVQYCAHRHLSCYAGWANSSRSLMSLSMLRGVPINCLYGYPVTDNVRSATKHSTLHLGSIVVSGRRVVYTIITMRITYDTLHNFLYSILIAGQSGINITPNIHTYV